MKRVLTSLIVTICVLVALTGVLYAHHGRGSTYDAKKVVDLKGTINKVMWRNPHIQFLVDVKGSGRESHDMDDRTQQRQYAGPPGL